MLGVLLRRASDRMHRQQAANERAVRHRLARLGTRTVRRSARCECLGPRHRPVEHAQSTRQAARRTEKASRAHGLFIAIRVDGRWPVRFTWWRPWELRSDPRSALRLAPPLGIRGRTDAKLASSAFSLSAVGEFVGGPALGTLYLVHSRGDVDSPSCMRWRDDGAFRGRSAVN